MRVANATLILLPDCKLLVSSSSFDFLSGNQRGPIGEVDKDGDVFVIAIGVAKFDVAIDQGEQRVVAPNADIDARLDLRAALAHDNAAGGDELAVKALDAEHLGLAIPTIAGATHTFLMCHELLLCLRVFRLRRATAAVFLLCCGIGSLFDGKRLCFSRLRLRFLGGSSVLSEIRRRARNQALAIGDDVIAPQESQLLSMAPFMPITTFL